MGTQGRGNEPLLDSAVNIELGMGNELCHLPLMQNLSTLRDSRLGGETNGGGGGAEKEIETKAVSAVAEEEQILDEGDPEAEAGWTQAVSICTVNRNTPRSEYPVNEVQRRSVAEPGSQDCVVLPSDTGFTAAYADVRLDIKQDRGRGFSQSIHPFCSVQTTALVDSGQNIQGGVCVSLEFALRLGYSAQQCASGAVTPNVYSAEGKSMKILGQLPVELFAMQFGNRGDFFVSRPWVLEGLSHHVNVGLNFLKSAAARIDFRSNCIRSDLYDLNAFLGNKDPKKLVMIKNPPGYTWPWQLPQKRFGGVDSQERGQSMMVLAGGDPGEVEIHAHNDVLVPPRSNDRLGVEFIDILIPPTFPEKGAISFEPGPKGASRGLTESILEVEKREDGGRWIKIPIYNGEEEWGEVSGGTSLGIITPWEGKGHFHEFEGQKDGGGATHPGRVLQ